MGYNLEHIPPDPAFLDSYTGDLVYHDAVWLTAHNAFANKEDGWKYAQQNLNLEHMFEKGVRGFMIDVHDYNGDLYLCHGSCLFTAWTEKMSFPDKLELWLQGLASLLSNNTADIITLHLESYASSKDIHSLLSKTGLTDFMLKSKNPNDHTLTLGEMRKNSARLVVFSDYSGESSRDNIPKDGSYPGLFPTTNYKETQYSLDEFAKCDMRTDFRANPGDSDVQLAVFNHFSKISAIKDYNSINRYSDIMKRVTSCLSNNIFPNFIVVDYFEQGECSNCMSTKNIVFTLNTLHIAIKNHSFNATTIAEPAQYSHKYNFYEYFKPFLCFGTKTITSMIVGEEITVRHLSNTNVNIPAGLKNIQYCLRAVGAISLAYFIKECPIIA
jgi:hypothetical protein